MRRGTSTLLSIRLASESRESRRRWCGLGRRARPGGRLCEFARIVSRSVLRLCLTRMRSRGAQYAPPPPPPPPPPPRPPPTDAEVYGGAPDAFTPVPNDVVVAILHLLPLHTVLRCGVLSKRFNVLTKTPLLFDKIVFTADMRGTPSLPQLAGLIRRAGGELRVLDITALQERQLVFAPKSPLEALRGSRVRELYLLGATRSCPMRVSVAEQLESECAELEAGSLALRPDSADQAMRALAVLPCCSKVLCMSRFEIPKAERDFVAVRFLDAAASCASITELDLSRLKNTFDNTLGPALGRLLSGNEGLISLNLSDINLHGAFWLGGPGDVAFFRALAENTGLRHLSLCYTNLSLEGMREMAAALSVNATLLTLDLSRQSRLHPFYAQEVQALADALAANSTLAELRLKHCSLGPVGVAAIAASLARNTGLRKLDLAATQGGSAGLQALQAAMAANATLQHLYMGVWYQAEGRPLLAQMELTGRVHAGEWNEDD